VGAIKLAERQNEIIKSDNRISYRAIAKKLDINDSAVDKHIKSLKEKGIYCRKACCYLFSFLPVRRYFWWIKGKQIKE
jgi:predicted transcriptional regulator